MREWKSAPLTRWAPLLAVAALVALGVLLAPTVLGSGGGRARWSGYVAGRDTFSGGGGSARLMQVTNLPTVVVPPAPPQDPAPAEPPVPAQDPAPAPAEPPAAPPAAPTGGATVLDNPNNTLPADLDPNRPYGPPVVRTDWVISKNYAAHGGPGPWGAIDFAFWYDRDSFGSAVVATHAGKVHLVENDPIYGNWVWVVNDHFTTRYGHNQKFLVTEGQEVVRGTLLAEIGSTGKSTGPHVDYQVWQDNENQNPMNFLK